MIDELISEYLSCAEMADSVDYSDKKSVRRFNELSDRLRNIVDVVVSIGQDAIAEFAIVLDREPAAIWAAHHLIEKADLDSETLAKCFIRVERNKREAEERGALATAMGEEYWLKEWKAKRG